MENATDPEALNHLIEDLKSVRLTKIEATRYAREAADKAQKVADTMRAAADAAQAEEDVVQNEIEVAMQRQIALFKAERREK